MATSTYFGWAEPDDTDLVKNGASAMRTLGNAIDATVYTTNYFAGKNKIINGDFGIWQRGTSFTVASSTYTFTADRFEVVRGATGLTVSRQATSDTTNLPTIQYCMRIARDSGNTSTTAIYVDHSIETANCYSLIGKAVTISFYARSGANYSPTSGALKVKGVNGTGTNQAIKNYTGANLFINSTVNVTSTWTRYTVSGTVPTNSGEFGIEFEINPTGTAGANDYVEITGVQLEAGATATPFQTATGTIQGELAACQRYYWRGTSQQYSPVCGLGGTASTTIAAVPVIYPVQMRIAPSALEYANICVQENFLGSVYAVTSATAANYSSTGCIAEFTIGSASLTQYRPARILANNSSSAYIGFSAEL
jgi:hypothetical protein